jgi:hypothetical protein
MACLTTHAKGFVREWGTELNNHINQMRNEWNNIKNT